MRTLFSCVYAVVRPERLSDLPYLSLITRRTTAPVLSSDDCGRTVGRGRKRKDVWR